MYWEKIYGWFTFQTLYDEMVKKYDNAIFVEIGTFKGKSIVYLAEEVKKANKNIKIYGIDLFIVDGQMIFNSPDLKTPKGYNFYEEFIRNIEPVKEYITPIQMSSLDAYKEFEDESVDFLFIDGEHLYEIVIEELNLWYPKIKKGGIIGGHDYWWGDGGVKKAVGEFFPMGEIKIESDDSTWTVYKS